jgi:hypothetical protein
VVEHLDLSILAYDYHVLEHLLILQTNNKLQYIYPSLRITCAASFCIAVTLTIRTKHITLHSLTKCGTRPESLISNAYQIFTVLRPA